MTRCAIESAVAEVLSAFPQVGAAWIFGSEARGTAREDSDLDIAILLMERGLDALEFSDELGRIAAHLQGVAPGRRIDLVLIESQGPVFQHAVLSEGQLVYERDRERRIDFESDAVVRYLDFKPLYERTRRVAMNALDAWFKGQHDR